MREGIDFNETFATVPCLTSLRFFLAHAAQHDWDVWQGDVSTAFLAAKLDTDLYMAVPNWFCKQPNGSEAGFTIRKALKAIYNRCCRGCLGRGFSGRPWLSLFSRVALGLRFNRKGNLVGVNVTHSMPRS